MIQIVEQTHNEKVEMYKKCTKMELIGMLISSNLHLEAVIKQLHKPVVMQGLHIESKPIPQDIAEIVEQNFDKLIDSSPTVGNSADGKGVRVECKHVCGSQGYNPMLGDTCEGCENERKSSKGQP